MVDGSNPKLLPKPDAAVKVLRMVEVSIFPLAIELTAFKPATAAETPGMALSIGTPATI